MDIKDKFSKFTTPNYYSRVDSQHILELHIGLDEKGRKAIKLRSVFTPRTIKGTSAIEVKQFKNDKYMTIIFSLCDEEISGLFNKFCDDLIESTRSLKDPASGYHAIINRFFLWKKMFVESKKKLLTEPEIMGLIGELCFLKDNLFEIYGQSKALSGWSGPELTHKDFSYNNIWYEVKAVQKKSLSIHISSIEQLDSEIDGVLAIVPMEKMSPAFNGCCLNRLAKDIMQSFNNEFDRELFMSKLAFHGFVFHDYYDEFVYAIDSCKLFSVSMEFPRLKKEDLNKAIIKANYDISIKDIMQFEIL